MPNLNSVHLIGLLTRDPELRNDPLASNQDLITNALVRRLHDQLLGETQKAVTEGIQERWVDGGGAVLNRRNSRFW